MRSGSPPWHMWGNQLEVNLVATAAPFDIESTQLVNINYGRPETWSWLFWAQVVADSGIGNPGVVQVRFNLTTGVGRTRLTLADFVTFIWTPTLPNLGLSYTTSTTDDTPGPAAAQILSDIPAEDIVLNVSSIITGGAAPGRRGSSCSPAAWAPAASPPPRASPRTARGSHCAG